MQGIAEFRNPEQYKDFLREMFLTYVRSEQFAVLSEEERNRAVDCYEELTIIFEGSKEQGAEQNGAIPSEK